MPIKAKWTPFKKVVIEALSLNESGVYEIGKARGNVVLYIGKTDKAIRSRLLEHKEKTKFVPCTHFRKRRTSPDDADKAERILMDNFRKLHNGNPPKLNKQKPTMRNYNPYW